jgi:hypothetical protein
VLADGCAAIVEGALLRDQHVRAIDVVAGDRPSFARGDVLEPSPDMDRSGAPAFFCAPWHRLGQRPVHLEDAGAVAVPAESTRVAAGEMLPGDPQQLAWGDVEEIRPRSREIVQVLDRVVGDHPAPELFQMAAHGVGDLLGPPGDARPTHRVRQQRQQQCYAGGRRGG